MKRIFYLFIFAFFFQVNTLVAQDDIDNIIGGSVEDANYLVTGYVTPFLKSLGNGLNQGWYNTAKPHKVAGFDLTITVSPIYIPNSDKTYEVDNLKMTNLEVITPAPVGGKANVPTLFGPEEAPTYRNKNTGATFDGPPGIDLKKNIGLNALPMPMAQFSFGLPKGIELKFRYVPKLDIGDDGSFNLFGIGVMHDVKQYIPGIKNLPFDLSGFVGYTKMKLDNQMSDTNPDQIGFLETKATTIQGIISKKFAVLTLYGSVGYNMSKTTLALRGDYEFDNPSNPSQPTIISNPVNIDVKSNGLRTTAGMRLKLAVFTFHADYTLQKYKTLTVGFGISVR